MIEKYNMLFRLILCVCFLFFNPEISLGMDNDESTERSVCVQNFKEAMKYALSDIGNELLEKANKVTIGRVGDGKGHVIGIETEGQREKNFKIRIDWAPTKGSHLNVEKGHGVNREKTAYIFQSTHELVYTSQRKKSKEEAPEEIRQIRHALKAQADRSDNEKDKASHVVEFLKSLGELQKYPSERGLFKQQCGFEDPISQHMRNEILPQLKNVTPENNAEQQSQEEISSHENCDP